MRSVSEVVKHERELCPDNVQTLLLTSVLELVRWSGLRQAENAFSWQRAEGDLPDAHWYRERGRCTFSPLLQELIYRRKAPPLEHSSFSGDKANGLQRTEGMSSPPYIVDQEPKVKTDRASIERPKTE